MSSMRKIYLINMGKEIAELKKKKGGGGGENGFLTHEVLMLFFFFFRLMGRAYATTK
jgi:hypothetical protein